MRKSEDSIECFSEHFEITAPEHSSSRLIARRGDENRVDDEERDVDVRFIWNNEILPHSWYQKQILSNRRKRRYLNRVEKLKSADIYRISPRKLSRLLTAIDLSILRRITPSELVYYDGSGNDNCINIRHIKSKNTGLANFVAYELSTRGNYKYFFKLLKHLERSRNYNSFYCIVKAFQMQKLDLKKLNILSTYMEKSLSYFDMRQILDDLTAQEVFFICPLDIYIKDVEDANRNKSSEIASMRFCRLVEILIKLQNQDTEIRISHGHEHFLLDKFWCYFQRSLMLSEISEEKKYDGQFLLI